MEKTFIGLPIIHYIPYLQYSDKNESSQGCGPQTCELLALFCKSEAFLIKHFIHRNTEMLEFAEEFPNHIIL